MTDDEFRGLFHGLELRMERFEGRLEALDKRLTETGEALRGEIADIRSEVRTRFDGLEGRLAGKAESTLV